MNTHALKHALGASLLLLLLAVPIQVAPIALRTSLPSSDSVPVTATPTMSNWIIPTVRVSG